MPAGITANSSANVLTRLDRVISGNTMERAMTRSSQVMTLMDSPIG